MKDFSAIIFDLDGTLIDSLQDIADAMNRTLKSFGYPIFGYESYKYFVGNGLRNLVFQCLPEKDRNEQQIEKVLLEMMKEYEKTAVVKTHLYTGIDNLLNYLTDKKIKMSILSNKADVLTQKITKKLLSSWLFEIILGETGRFPRKPNPESAMFIAKEMDINPKKILYVGDTGIDMQTAKAAGIFSVGVTWGFRGYKELEENGAGIIINHPFDIVKLIETGKTS